MGDRLTGARYTEIEAVEDGSRLVARLQELAQLFFPAPLAGAAEVNVTTFRHGLAA